MKKNALVLFTAVVALSMTGGTAAAQSQDTNSQTNSAIGNPQIRDFELPGTRTTPPRPAEPQASPPPATRPTTESPAPRTTPAPSPATPAIRPLPRPTTAQPRQPAIRDPAPTLPPPSLPTPEVVRDAIPTPVEPAPAPALPAPPVVEAPIQEPVAEVAPVAAPEESGFPWLYLGLAALAALIGAVAFLKPRRRPAEDNEEPARVVAEPQAPVAPAPVAVPKPRPAPAASAPAAPAAPRSDVVGIQMRPWIEIEFTPARASATLTEANVQFELKLRNTGSAPAHNIRIEVRMFNAGPHQEQEVTEFYGEPIRERTPPALPMLPPKTEAQITSAVAMPNENVREVTIQGRRLFIPTVAFNIVYDWGNGKTGQTSASYLVGREAEVPTEKMGAFRLDLGPRLYRSVGQRPTKLVRTV